MLTGKESLIYQINSEEKFCLSFCVLRHFDTKRKKCELKGLREPRVIPSVILVVMLLMTLFKNT